MEVSPNVDLLFACPREIPLKIKIRPNELVEEDRKKHDSLVALIATSRFVYPSERSPSLKTYVNLPRPTLSVTVSRTESIYPDIVVVNQVIKKAATIAEIETKMTIDNERAKRWRKYSSLHDTNFYLYVPQSEIEPVKQLISFFRVRVTVIRIYSYNSFGEPIIS